VRNNDRQALASPHPVRLQVDDGRFSLAGARTAQRARTRHTKGDPDMYFRTKVALLAFAIAAGLLAGCAVSTRHIADIQHYPGRYYDRSVAIEGTVTSSFGGRFLPVQYYKVDDGTGEITVLANGSRNVPRRGARVRVKGRVEELGAFGSRSFGLHMRQEDLDVRRW
jgi:hypothetical protein